MKIIEEIEQEMATASATYGPFTSSHEALGVITEEFWELVEAVRSNSFLSVEQEAIQLAAACIRLAEQSGEIRGSFTDFGKRSGF